ncbi:MAG: hypothetical protein ABSG51_17550 [Terracidiphilus sp.]|jgi:hypothetical protein
MRMGLLGNKMHPRAENYYSEPKELLAQDSSPMPRVLHFNSEGRKGSKEMRFQVNRIETLAE